MEDLVLRIKELMRSKQLSATDFADQIGVQKASISHILSGRNKPSLDFVLKVCERYKEVDANFLLFGVDTSTEEINTDQQVEENSGNAFYVSPDLGSSDSEIEKIIVLYKDKRFTEYKPNEST